MSAAPALHERAALMDELFFEEKGRSRWVELIGASREGISTLLMRELLLLLFFSRCIRLD